MLVPNGARYREVPLYKQSRHFIVLKDSNDRLHGKCDEVDADENLLYVALIH